MSLSEISSFVLHVVKEIRTKIILMRIVILFDIFILFLRVSNRNVLQMKTKIKSKFMSFPDIL